MPEDEVLEGSNSDGSSHENPKMPKDALANKKHKSNKDNKKKKKKKKRGGSKRRMTPEQTVAFEAVAEWAYLGQPLPASSPDGFGVDGGNTNGGGRRQRVVFELHSHSKCSDGFLSPSSLVERAHSNGVKVLALTDHDTMSGVPEAVEAAKRFGIRIIPGVEISTMFAPGNDKAEEPVHILAYYSSCGPTRFDEVEEFLMNIRDGRYVRAKDMVLKLNKLKLPVRWEHVSRIAGVGVAPGRLHVARAMVEAGHVENLKQAFARFLYDGGPAYSTGNEPDPEKAIQLIRKTGGLAVLAHPWALKDPLTIIERLKDAGLHGIEVYRGDGKLSVYSDLADTYGLLKLGGSDYHAKGGTIESELGSVNVPVLDLHEFIKAACPVWHESIKGILNSYAEEPSESNLARITRFGSVRVSNERVGRNGVPDLVSHLLSLWLTDDERRTDEFEAIMLKLSQVSV